MIRLILKGGLGNQMFQYAFAKSLAREKKDEIILDLTFLNTRLPIPGFTPREYELNFFDIEEKTETLFNNKIIDKYFSYLILTIMSRTIDHKKYIKEDESPYFYDEELVNKALSVKTPVLMGYWNNYKYFKKYEKEIKKTFDMDKLFDKKFTEIETKIKNTNSLSINIRRGDYTNKKHSGVFTFLDEDYYKKAIEIMRKKVKNPHFYVFSYDDPEWFEKTFNMKKNEYTIMGHEYVGDRFKTYLRLIYLCKHNIISNSTFAWWGAYLNKNKDKIVISPKKWLIKYDFENIDNWIEI